MKVLLIVTGPAGSGKSYIATKLSSALNIPYIDYDSVNRYFIDFLLDKKWIHADEDPLSIVRVPSYKILTGLALDLLKNIDRVMIAAPFTKEKYSCSEYISNVKQAIETPTMIIDISIVVSPETLHQHIVQRNVSRDARILQHWDEFISQTPKRPGVWNVDHTIHYNNEKQPADITFLVKELITYCGTYTTSGGDITL